MCPRACVSSRRMGAAVAALRGVLCRRFGQVRLEQLWLQHANRYRVGPLQLARGSRPG